MRNRFSLCLLVTFAPIFASGSEPTATSPEAISTLPGFQVDLVRSSAKGEGSWISMTFDNAGRVLLADDVSGIHRLTLSPDSTADLFETLDNTKHLKHCRGILFAHHSLYISETDGRGIHRFQDLDGDGQFETQNLVVPLIYQSRYGHGANQIRLGPDDRIYIAIGNDVFHPETRNRNSPYQETRNDWLLPNPHDGEQDPRSGFILRMNPDGSDQIVLNGGLRNQVDIAFNSDGELFTWDADMEWDVGLPWYRPTRFNHIVSGGEYGWRWGTGKWPSWFPDSLPSNLDTGLGSPTGITFGEKSNWPDRFKKGMYAADWQHGRLLLVDMYADGASYRGESTLLAEGSPLNISDIEFGPDGNLYFITGGRGSQSGLYRITYDAETEAKGEGTKTKLSPEKEMESAHARIVRRKLEQLHTEQSSDQIPFIWSHLSSRDTWIRFAARVALENQPIENWISRLANERDPRALQTAWMALARSGANEHQSQIVQGLLEQLRSDQEDADRVWTLRTLQLSLIRHGIPSPNLQAELQNALANQIETNHYPTVWLVGELLVALESPEAAPFLLNQLSQGTTQEEQIQCMKSLVRVKVGWDFEARVRALEWFIASRKLPGGRLVATTLANLQEDFRKSLSTEETTRLESLLTDLAKPVDDQSEAPVLNARPVVQNWTMETLSEALKNVATKPRDLEAGRKLVAEASCLRCHSFEDRGSHIGPELTSVGKRFDQHALLESIVEPSKQIDPKYAISNYQLTDGRVLTGRAAWVSGSQLAIETDQLTGSSVTIQRSEIEQTKLSSLSPMPTGLLDGFKPEEITDLIAYLLLSRTSHE